MGERKIKVGDWVIGWHAYHENFKTMAWHVGEITDQNNVRPRININWCTNLTDVRHATVKELSGIKIAEPSYSIY